MSAYDNDRQTINKRCNTCKHCLIEHKADKGMCTALYLEIHDNDLYDPKTFGCIMHELKTENDLK